MKKLKILFITPAYYPNLIGGSERSLKILAEGLVKRGIDIVVFSFDGDKKISYENYNGVKIVRFKKPRFKPKTVALNISLLLKKKYVKREKPDIIHVYNTWQIPAASFLRRYTKIVATLNNYYPIIAIGYTRDNLIETGDLSFNKIFNSIYKTLSGNFLKKLLLSLFYTLYGKIYITPKSKKLDAYIAYAKGIKKIYEMAGFDRKKIKIIRSPFEIPKKINIEVKRKKNIVLYVGGALESKGFYDLMTAIKTIKNKDIEFRIAGVEKNNPIVKNFLTDKRIKFLGKLNEIELAKQYLEANILVHPSIWPEPFSRVWLEALNYNVPIISADNPVALEVLKGAAIFYRRKHPAELAKKIQEFLEDKLKINRKNYLETKKKIFSQNPIKEMIEFYKKLK